MNTGDFSSCFAGEVGDCFLRTEGGNILLCFETCRWKVVQLVDKVQLNSCIRAVQNSLYEIYFLSLIIIWNGDVMSDSFVGEKVKFWYVLIM